MVPWSQLPHLTWPVSMYGYPSQRYVPGFVHAHAVGEVYDEVISTVGPQMAHTLPGFRGGLLLLHTLHGVKVRYLIKPELPVEKLQSWCLKQKWNLEINAVLGHNAALEGYTRPGTTWANEMNFVTNRAPDAGLITQPADLQSSMLPLCFGCPLTKI